MIPNLEGDVGEELMKLCIYERDFLIGGTIINNVVESMENSRNVILLLSNSFLESSWCSWEMRFAQSKQIDEKRELIILIVLEKIAKEKITPALRFLMRTSTCLEWDGNPRAQKGFWKKLQYVLQRHDCRRDNFLL